MSAMRRRSSFATRRLVERSTSWHSRHSSRCCASRSLISASLQREVVRTQVFVPQDQAFGMRPADKAVVRVPEVSGRTFPSKVTRLADALQPGTRTLLAEIDVPIRTRRWPSASIARWNSTSPARRPLFSFPQMRSFSIETDRRSPWSRTRDGRFRPFRIPPRRTAAPAPSLRLVTARPPFPTLAQQYRISSGQVRSCRQSLCHFPRGQWVRRCQAPRSRLSFGMTGRPIPSMASPERLQTSSQTLPSLHRWALRKLGQWLLDRGESHWSQLPERNDVSDWRRAAGVAMSF
jgi:hypothetical protein